MHFFLNMNLRPTRWDMRSDVSHLHINSWILLIMNFIVHNLNFVQEFEFGVIVHVLELLHSCANVGLAEGYLLWVHLVMLSDQNRRLWKYIFLMMPYLLDYLIRNVSSGRRLGQIRIPRHRKLIDSSLWLWFFYVYHLACSHIVVVDKFFTMCECYVWNHMRGYFFFHYHDLISHWILRIELVQQSKMFKEVFRCQKLLFADINLIPVSDVEFKSLWESSIWLVESTTLKEWGFFWETLEELWWLWADLSPEWKTLFGSYS